MYVLSPSTTTVFVFSEFFSSAAPRGGGASPAGVRRTVHARAFAGAKSGAEMWADSASLPKEKWSAGTNARRNRSTATASVRLRKPRTIFTGVSSALSSTRRAPMKTSPGGGPRGNLPWSWTSKMRCLPAKSGSKAARMGSPLTMTTIWPSNHAVRTSKGSLGVTFVGCPVFPVRVSASRLSGAFAAGFGERSGSSAMALACSVAGAAVAR